MKKTIITILTFLIAINLVYAQKENKKSVIGVSSGISIPFADFANKKMVQNAGFAGIGANIEVDFLRYSGKFFGLSSNIGYTSISFNENAYKTEYDQILGHYGETEVNAGNYQVLKGLLGLILKIPEIKHTEVLFIFQVGYALSVHPELLVTNSELGEINTVQKVTDWNPISNAGVKINYWLSEKYGINLSYNLNFTTPGFFDYTGFGKTFFLPVRYKNINVGFVMNL